jgi:hypothetical protein
VHLQACWDGPVDQVQELLELDGPVAGGELVGDDTGGQVQRGVQIDGAVADIIMAHPLIRSSAHPLIRSSAHPLIRSSAHPLIRSSVQGCRAAT